MHVVKFKFTGSTEPVRSFIEKKPDPNQLETSQTDDKLDSVTDRPNDINFPTNNYYVTEEPPVENNPVDNAASSKNDDAKEGNNGEEADANTNNPGNGIASDQGDYKYDGNDGDYNNNYNNYDDTRYGGLKIKENLPEDAGARGVIPDLPKDEDEPDEFKRILRDFVESH